MALVQTGVTKGQSVAVYLPVSPIAVATMLACARIGAVHSVVFAGFSAQALASRIRDGSSNCLNDRKIEVNNLIFVSNEVLI